MSLLPFTCSASLKDPVARKARLRRRREADMKAQQVLKGMSDLTENKYNKRRGSGDDVSSS